MVQNMVLSASISEWITYMVFTFIGIVGNSILIHGILTCPTGRLRPSFLLLFSLAAVHMARNVVVNLLSIIYSAGGVSVFGSAGCKVFKFASALTGTLGIWFTLYTVVFYSVKLEQAVHPLNCAVNTNWRGYHLAGIFVLWVAGLVVCCPIAVFAEKAKVQVVGNVTHPYRSSVYVGCRCNYPAPEVALIYGTLALTAIDLVPLVVLAIFSIRIMLLLRKRTGVQFGDIWIGERTETDVFRAAKCALLLVLLVTALWVSHFTILQCLRRLDEYYFIPTVLAVLSSGYATLSPYLLMIINYRIRANLWTFFYGHPQDINPQVDTVISPYAN
nr:PREDICTED: neuropeptide Y receptor type 2-like [Latimeria chalumnae]|eukprot:XP_014339688.1 PREDICTED: neuropeptide Y receptor type 2-like [Latimeria chalumnae]